jgi:cell division septum initiation protein DivIVA
LCCRGTSRKQARDQYIKEIVQQRRLLDVLEKRVSAAVAAADSVTYQTALIRAADTSQHQLSSSYNFACLKVLAGQAPREPPTR